MRNKKRTYPGSIFAQDGYIYVNVKGKRYATHLTDNKIGRERAKEFLEQIWEKENDLENRIVKGMYIEDAYKKFEEFKINLYEKTRKNYKLAFNAIIRKNYTMNIEDIERDVQYYIRNTEHSAVTINTYLTNLQIFLSYCIKKKIIMPVNLKEDYKVKEIRTHPDIWQKIEIESIISYYEKEKNAMAVMLKFMLMTGARFVDCLNLLPSNIKEEKIYFHNKITKKIEIRPLPKKAKDILEELPKYKDRIFPWRYSTSSKIHKWFNDACKKLNIERNGRSLQEFRITYRMMLVDAGTPEVYIQYLMRHSKQETTFERYTRLEENPEIKKYIEKIHF